MAPSDRFPAKLEREMAPDFYDSKQVEKFLSKRKMGGNQEDAIRTNMNRVGYLNGKFSSESLHEIFQDSTLVQDFEEFAKRQLD